MIGQLERNLARLLRLRGDDLVKEQGDQVFADAVTALTSSAGTAVAGVTDTLPAIPPVG